MSTVMRRPGLAARFKLATVRTSFALGGRLAPAETAAHFNPAYSLNHPVEQHEVRLDLIGQDKRFLTVPGAGHGIAGPVEVKRHQLSKGAVVLDQ